MNRRDFLKSSSMVAAGLAVAPVVAATEAAPVAATRYVPLGPSGHFGLFNGTDIRYVGDGTRYDVLELHRWIQEYRDELFIASDYAVDVTEGADSVRFTDNMFGFRNGLNIDDEAAMYLKNGSIEQGEEVYRCITSIGKIESGTTITTYDEEGNVLHEGTYDCADENNMIDSILVRTHSTDVKMVAQGEGIIGTTWDMEIGVGNFIAVIVTGKDHFYPKPNPFVSPLGECLLAA